ncbi:hypothetical protein NQ317_008048 [Molorchus minor]|uniref:Uncharacterized protein n=1 Tax=Molorchus minor TaxID=1323400 RepID=A0ABQ9JQJ2_9CUCU|nr:hypothetical protein NQ317_008048 [Molorchus minor]
MEEISSWSQRDRLILNDLKTVFMQFHIQKPLPHNTALYDNCRYSSRNYQTHPTKHYQLQLTLTQNCHGIGILNMFVAYFAILQMKNSLDQTGLLNIYYSLAYSFVSYNILCWGSATERDRVFICQKRIIRLIFKLNFNESCRKIFKDENILTTPCIFIYKCFTYVKKNMDLFIKRHECHSYSTRNVNLLHIPKHHTTKFRHAPHYSCIIFYNSLPLEIRDLTNYKKYKYEVKKLPLKGSFYSTNNFLNREPVGI